MQNWIFIVLIGGILIQCSFGVDQRPLQANCSSRDATMYFATKHSIYHVLINNIPHSLDLLLNTVESGEISSLDYNQLNHTLLFTSDSHPNRVFEVNVWTRTITHFDYEDVDFREIVFDPNTGNIYFVNKLGALGVCKWKLHCVYLISPSIIRSLVLQPKLGRMFYINGMDSNSVWMVSMNGKHSRKIEGTNGAHAISVHPDKRFLFVNTETLLMEIDLTLARAYTPQSLMKASTIYYFNCKLYYVGRVSKTLKIFKAPNDNEKNIHHFTDTANYPLTIGINERTISKEDVCKKLDCSGICVIGEDVTGTKAECIYNESPKKEEESGPKIHWILIGIFVLILLLLTILFITIKFRLSPILSDWIDRKFGSRNIKVVKYNGSILIDANNS